MSEIVENQGKASIAELQRLTGVDRATIGKRIAHISPEFGTKGAKLYEVRQVLPLIMAQKSADGDESKDRKAAADAEKAELIVARLRGELVPVADMKEAAAELIKTMYQQIVRVQPGIIASEVVGMTDAVEIEVKIRESISKIFDDLRSSPDKFLAVDAPETVESEVE